MSAMNRDRIAEFLDRFVGYASGATTVGLLAVADRCGLLVWLGEHGSGTALEIASGVGLEERYVVEILSGLAAARVVEYEPESGIFTLPPEHSLFLADETSPYFMGGWMDMIPAFYGQIDGVARAARDGGGVGFDEYGERGLRGIDRGNSPSQRVFLVRRWLPAVPGLVDRLEQGVRIADVGCGSGTAARLMAEAFPRSQVVGYDMSEESLELARSRAGSLANLEYIRAKVSEIPVDPPFELITAFDVVHDLPDPLVGLTRIRDALSPDGQFLMMEPNVNSRLEENIGDDRAALMYGVSTLHCMTQSLAQGGVGVGAAWGGERAEDHARRAGFTGFELLEDITNKFSAFYLLTP